MAASDINDDPDVQYHVGAGVIVAWVSFPFAFIGGVLLIAERRRLDRFGDYNPL